MNIKKLIMLGDVVGEAGLAALERELPRLIEQYAADFVVVNGENAAEGFGITEPALARMLAAGADIVTSGNHVWEKREFWSVLDAEPRVLRPANYPQGSAGRGWARVEKNGASWIVVNLQGRELMTPIDCPFHAFDAALETASEEAPAARRLVLVDFHAESTAEKEALAFYLDGRASVVAGTHTHVQTADNRVLPQGCAYITDLGMTGVQESVIGMDTQICVNRAKRQVLYHMECASGEGRVQGIHADIDADSGQAVSIARL
jgi:metallophosphoesterase (TIGR00282 family)